MEIIPLPTGKAYPAYAADNHNESMAEITKEYYERRTDRKSFITRDILTYDLETHTYHTADWFSEDLTKYMLNYMDFETAEMFQKFAQENWKSR